MGWDSTDQNRNEISIEWGGQSKIFKSLKGCHIEGMARESHCFEGKTRQRDCKKNRNWSHGADPALRGHSGVSPGGNATPPDTDLRSWPRHHYGLSSMNVSVLSLSLFL